MKKEYTAISHTSGLVVKVTIEAPEDLPMSGDALALRAEALAAVGLGTFGLMPSDASQFLTACIRVLKAEYEAEGALEN